MFFRREKGQIRSKNYFVSVFQGELSLLSHIIYISILFLFMFFFSSIFSVLVEIEIQLVLTSMTTHVRISPA